MGFTKFAGGRLRRGLFFNGVTGLRVATLLERKIWHKCFPVYFKKFLRTPYLQNTSERLLLVLFVARFFMFSIIKNFCHEKNLVRAKKVD